jgi:hypothetical protein
VAPRGSCRRQRTDVTGLRAVFRISSCPGRTKWEGRGRRSASSGVWKPAALRVRLVPGAGLRLFVGTARHEPMNRHTRRGVRLDDEGRVVGTFRNGAASYI